MWLYVQVWPAQLDVGALCKPQFTSRSRSGVPVIKRGSAGWAGLGRACQCKNKPSHVYFTMQSAAMAR